MKLLTTGSASFIGSAVIRHIINSTADEVVNIDKLTNVGNLESLAQASTVERSIRIIADLGLSQGFPRLIK